MSGQFLERKITQAWQQQAKWLWVLLPLSGLYAAITSLRRYGYQQGLLKQYRAPVPVMVIGNISVGGSGKTPLIISLVEHLQQLGIKPGVISRGYGGDESAMPALVTAESQPDVVGDEPCLIVAQTQVAMAVCPNRQRAIEILLAHDAEIELIIADDGLQHYALARDIEWIVVDANRGFGNAQLLPTGFLREPLSRLAKATVIWHHAEAEIDGVAAAAPSLAAKRLPYVQGTERLTMQLHAQTILPVLSVDEIATIINALPYSLSPLSASTISEEKPPLAHLLHQLAVAQQYPPQHNSAVQAVSGIGYPARFFASLRHLGYQLHEHPYPDHYQFQWSDIVRHSLQQPAAIIVTSKDAIKIAPILRHRLKQLLKAWLTAQTEAGAHAHYPADLPRLHQTSFHTGEAVVNAKQSTLTTPFEELAQLMHIISRLWVLPVNAVLSDDCYNTLHQQLTALGIAVSQ